MYLTTHRSTSLTVMSACQGSRLACTRTVSIFRLLPYMQTRFRHQNIILHSYRNEINTVNQLQLNYFTNIHLLIPRFMKSLCVITIKLNTQTNVPYQMTVGGWKCVKEVASKIFEQWSRVYNGGFSPWTQTNTL